jgi:hypothetical protein
MGLASASKDSVNFLLGNHGFESRHGTQDQSTAIDQAIEYQGHGHYQGTAAANDKHGDKPVSWVAAV